MYRLEKFYPLGFNPQQYWDDRYAKEHIAGKSSEEFRRQGFWPLLETHLKHTRRYLDAGCGVGGWIIFLREEGYEVEGIDVAARVVRSLTEYDPDLKIKVAPLTRIPYPDETFDGVLNIGSLEFVEGRVPEALAEVSRVLKPGGILFIEVPLANTYRRWLYLPLKRLERAIKTRFKQRATFASYLFDRQTLAHLLEAAQFEVLTMQPHELPDPDSHYGLYIDWPIFRGREPYRLNLLGRVVKAVANALSPWLASTGMVVVARKK